MSVSVMKKLTVFAFCEDADALLRKLVRLRCVEIQRTEASEDALQLRRMDADEALSEAENSLKNIRSALPELVKYSTENKGIGRSLRAYDGNRFSSDGSLELAKRTVTQTLELMSRGQELRRELQRVRAQADVLTPWMELETAVEQMTTEKTKTALGCCPPSVKLDAAEAALAELDACAEVISSNKNGTYLAVTYLKSMENEIGAALSALGFLAVDLSMESGTPLQQADRLELERETLETQLQELEERMRDLAENLHLVEIYHDLTDTDRTVAELHRRLAQTERCAVLEGWIPAFAEERVAQALSKYECAYETREPAAGEDPPVLLRNRRIATNFEWVVGMYSYPQYGRFDPTVIMSVFYFLIFGLMFADVGYGLLLVIGGFGGAKLFNPKVGMKRMLHMFGYCGISAMLMGVLFGGWFGDLPVAIMQNMLGLSVESGVGHFFGSGLWFNPLDNPLAFLILSLAVGGVHLIAGMAVRFYILCKDGKADEAICTIIPYWILFAGLLLLLVDGAVGSAVSIAGGALIVLLNGYGIRNPFKRLFKGLGGIYGLINYASDLLSYSRILALGLVAAVIAKVINMITALGDNGIFGAVVMVVVLLVGHVLNLAINVLGSFVHTSRLQYMEFFGKFYEDGGRVFEPAAPTEDYSEEQSEDGI